MKAPIIEDINILPKYLLKNDGTLFQESERKGKSGKKKSPVDPEKTYEEGAWQMYIERMRRKRDPNLRPDAIKKYGYICHVCKTNLENSIYGKYGIKCIEVHHLNPVANIEGQRNTKVSEVNIPDHRSGHHCANLRTLRAQICFTAPLRDAVLFTGIHPRSQNGAFC